MALILSIETSTPVCSVALTDSGNTLAIEKLFLEKSHSNLLTLVIESVCKHAGVEMKSIDALAVSEGPGSYTGLRIGVSTAKGICYALEKPLIAVPTLEAMAYEVNTANPFGYLLCPMLDARRMEVYAALYSPNLSVLHEVKPVILDEQSYQETLADKKMLFFGDGSNKFKALVEANANAGFVEGVSPSAWAVGKIASAKFSQNNIVDLAYFEPFYLKEYKAAKPKKLL